MDIFDNYQQQEEIGIHGGQGDIGNEYHYGRGSIEDADNNFNNSLESAGSLEELQQQNNYQF